LGIALGYSCHLQCLASRYRVESDLMYADNVQRGEEIGTRRE
jgi:hypothetical protein